MAGPTLTAVASSLKPLCIPSRNVTLACGWSQVKFLLIHHENLQQEAFRSVSV